MAASRVRGPTRTPEKISKFYLKLNEKSTIFRKNLQVLGIIFNFMVILMENLLFPQIFNIFRIFRENSGKILEMLLCEARECIKKF